MQNYIEIGATHAPTLTEVRPGVYAYVCPCGTLCQGVLAASRVESTAPSLRSRLEAATPTVRLGSPPCSCPGAIWDSITPPPPVCALHGAAGVGA